MSCRRWRLFIPDSSVGAALRPSQERRKNLKADKLKVDFLPAFQSWTARAPGRMETVKSRLKQIDQCQLDPVPAFTPDFQALKHS